MIDWRGTEIEEGDLIVYPTGSTSPHVIEAEVVEVDDNRVRGRNPAPGAVGKPYLRARKIRYTTGHGTTHDALRYSWERPTVTFQLVPGRVTVVEKAER